MTLVADFQAMVDEMRPVWLARLAEEQAVRAAWVMRPTANRPPPKPLTVDDYRARLRGFDEGKLQSDDEWQEAVAERMRLTDMARQFDPDFSIWREIRAQRRNA